MTTYLDDDRANDIYQWVFRGPVPGAMGGRFLTLFTDVAAGTEAAVARIDAASVFDDTPNAGDGDLTSTASFTMPGTSTTIDGAGIMMASAASAASGTQEMVRWSITPRTYAPSEVANFNGADLQAFVDPET